LVLINIIGQKTYPHSSITVPSRN